MAYNFLWYGVVRDYEAKTYQFTPTFFTSHKPSKTSETRMHYTMCYQLAFITIFIIFKFLYSITYSCGSSAKIPKQNSCLSTIFTILCHSS